MDSVYFGTMLFLLGAGFAGGGIFRKAGFCGLPDRLPGNLHFPGRFRFRKEQAQQVVQEAPAARGGADREGVALEEPGGLGARERAPRPPRAASPVRSANIATGKPSASRSAFIMNSKARSPAATSCASWMALPASACVLVGLRLPEARLAHDAVGEGELGVRAGAHAEVVAEAPVVEVVARAPPRLREGRGLVVLVARAGELAPRSPPASPAAASSSGSGGG